MAEPGAVLIREYRDSDAAGVRACIIELQEFERRINPRLRAGESMADGYLAQMLERCRDWTGKIFVADAGGEIAGMATVHAHVPFEALDDPPGDYALVSDLVVRSAYHRAGIGTALLTEAERFARGSGATEIRIGVLNENRPAYQLYVREGFAPYLTTLVKPLAPGAG